MKGRFSDLIAYVLSVSILEDHLGRMFGVHGGDLHAWNRLDRATLAETGSQIRRQVSERSQELIHAGRRPNRCVVLLGEWDGIADVIAVSVRDEDDVDLAELVEVLPLGRALGVAGDPWIDHHDLAVGCREPEGRLAKPL